MSETRDRRRDRLWIIFETISEAKHKIQRDVDNNDVLRDVVEIESAIAALCDAESAISAALIALDSPASHLRLVQPRDSFDPDDIPF